MLQVFKHFSSAAVWIIFISGCITIFVSTLNWVIRVGMIGNPEPAMFVAWIIGTAQLFLAVVAAKLRQMME